MKRIHILPLVACIAASLETCPPETGLCGTAVAQAAVQKPAAPAAQDPRVGRKVLITKAGAELRTPNAIVWKAYLGEVFTVLLTNGEWLWIEEKGGWIWEKETVLYDTAIDEISKRLSGTPTAENFHLRGVAYLAHKQYDKAIADFSESLRKSPRNAGALNNRGQASYLKGDYKAAIQDFTGAITIDPKNFLAFNNRALAHIESENLQAAMSDLESALKLVPEYPEALNNRGIVFQKMNRLDEALADFTAALKIYPKYIDALGNRAYTHQLKKDFAKSIADLDAALAINPTSFEALNDLAWLLATTSEDSVRNGQRAIQLATQAVELTGSKDWNTLDTLAAAQAEMGDFDAAGASIAKSIQLAPVPEKARLQSHQQLIGEKKPIRN